MASSFGSARVKTPLVFSGARIGIMGGTFNPPHAGHAIVAETALKRLGLDQVWWVVTPGNPLKSTNGLEPQSVRLAASRLIARGPRMMITGFEASLGTSYTAATLAFLKRRYPGVRFVWVMGADNLASIHRWQDWQTIFDTMPIAVVDRPGWRLKALASLPAQRYGAARIPERRSGLLVSLGAPAWTFLTSRLSPLSSTQLRSETRQVSKSTR